MPKESDEKYSNYLKDLRRLRYDIDDLSSVNDTIEVVEDRGGDDVEVSICNISRPYKLKIPFRQVINLLYYQ